MALLASSHSASSLLSIPPKSNSDFSSAWIAKNSSAASILCSYANFCFSSSFTLFIIALASLCCSCVTTSPKLKISCFIKANCLTTWSLAAGPFNISSIILYVTVNCSVFIFNLFILSIVTAIPWARFLLNTLVAIEPKVNNVFAPPPRASTKFVNKLTTLVKASVTAIIESSSNKESYNPSKEVFICWICAAALSI